MCIYATKTEQNALKTGHNHYTIQSPCPDGGQPRNITGWRRQFRVDTSEILGEAEPEAPEQNATEHELPEIEPPEYDTAEPTPLPNSLTENEAVEQAESENPEVSPRRLWVWLLLLPVCFGAWLVVKPTTPQ